MAKIRFRDLSFWLKIAVIGGWIICVFWIIGILIGFIGAMMGVE